MQTSDLNVNNTESDHANAIFRQFQDAIFSREHTYVKTLTKIIFDLLQWQEIAKLSLPKKAAIVSFIWTTFRAHFRLRANDITRNRSRVISSRACVDIFRQWSRERASFAAQTQSFLCGIFSTVRLEVLPNLRHGRVFQMSTMVNLGNLGILRAFDSSRR